MDMGKYNLYWLTLFTHITYYQPPSSISPSYIGISDINKGHSTLSG